MPIFKISDRVLLKIEAKYAMEIFKEKYRKIPIGIKNIFQNLMLTDEFEKVKKEHKRLFGYIKKSKRAKEKFSELEEE